MKINGSEKSSVAWFKLAEYVGRGERERALTLYRLLIHSLVDQAFVKKLEADLWLSFDALEAEQCYRTAAEMYAKANKYEEAFQIYQLLYNHYTFTIVDFERCVELAVIVGLKVKEQFFAQQLMSAFIEKASFDDARRLFFRYQNCMTSEQCLNFYMTFIFKALQASYHETDKLREFVDATVISFKAKQDAVGLENFLQRVAIINQGAYKSIAPFV